MPGVSIQELVAAAHAAMPGAGEADYTAEDAIIIGGQSGWSLPEISDAPQTITVYRTEGLVAFVSCKSEQPEIWDPIAVEFCWNFPFPGGDDKARARFRADIENLKQTSQPPNESKRHMVGSLVYDMWFRLPPLGTTFEALQVYSAAGSGTIPAPTPTCSDLESCG